MIGVRRSAQAPRVLMDSGAQNRYRHDDVVDQLMKDFHGKCYICEIDDLQSIEVEHLLPHHNGKYPDRMFEWNNLFLSCRHCNSVKTRRNTTNA
ncbi:MAG: HNH endonuclease [Atopobiaceae bacterium]|nr:HNH endonuclease [Atopobiaceae bacterium]